MDRWTDFNERKISLIRWPMDSDGNQRVRGSTVTGSVNLVGQYAFHGEYDDFWVLEMDAHGHEVARYCAKYLETIEWAPVEDTT
jgi:hypothetical protein